MAKLYIPTIKRDFNTDRVLYVNTRTKSKIGGLSHWGNTVPLTVKTPSTIATPSMPATRWNMSLNASGNMELGIRITPFTSNTGTTCKSVEYEIYKNLEHSNNLVYTGIYPYNQYLTDRFIIPAAIVDNVIVKLPEFYLRARYIDYADNKSAWTNMAYFRIMVVDSEAPEILTPPMTTFDANSTIVISRPVFRDALRGGEVINTDQQIVGVRIVMYDANGTVVDRTLDSDIIAKDENTYTVRPQNGFISYLQSIPEDRKPLSFTARCKFSMFVGPESEKYEIFEPKKATAPEIIFPEDYHATYVESGDDIVLEVADWVPTREGDDLVAVEYFFSHEPDSNPWWNDGTVEIQ